MRFLLDENIHRRLFSLLSDRGHDALYVPKGSGGGAVFAKAISESRILLTHDKDFSDADRFPPHESSGILLLHLNPLYVDSMLHAVDRVLSELPETKLKGSLVLVYETTFEICDLRFVI